ncbi:MAG TPA: site-specific DNA-methyltransferase [Ktedonobacteraceae bacterium]|nr:site-specific DNA-methyltransferase [Ktedonobacteraceae bacterium]
MAELIWKGKSDPPAQSVTQCHLQTLELISPPPESKQIQSNNQPPAWHNRLILGDKRTILPSLKQEFSEGVQLIYIDPPFMTGRSFNSKSQLASKPQLAYQDLWKNNLDTYLQWLYETCIELYQLLADDGSFYLHLDWRVVHHARMMLDEIFSLAHKGGGFKSEIIWHYQSGGRSSRSYARKHDTILFYTRSNTFCFHPERIGEKRGSHKRNHMRRQTDAQGLISWSINSSGRTYTYTEDQHMTPSDVWSDISHLHQRDPERNGYATQKPEGLLERIILASSEENDLVLDCFCGSGVTPGVAERLGRRWIACDQSELAIQLTRQRLGKLPGFRPFFLQTPVPIQPTTSEQVNIQVAQQGSTGKPFNSLTERA